MKTDYYDSLPRRGDFTTEKKAIKEMRRLIKGVKCIKDEFGKKIPPFDLNDSMDVLGDDSFFWEKNGRFQDYKEGFLPEKQE